MSSSHGLEITEMSIPNAFRITPHKIPDRRGSFYESFKFEQFATTVGFSLKVAQINFSVSRCNTLRGIHATTLPPGQAKLVTCVRGAALDVAVDLRVGSPSFGRFEITKQDEASGVSVYMADGIGHAFLALTDDVCMNYVCSEEYVHGTMVDVNPLDPEIGIPWGVGREAIMSDKDRAAPSAREAAASGLLPTYEQCLAHYASST